MPIMRRRPVLRAAAIGGGAYAAGKRRQEAREREYRERARGSEPEAQQSPAPPARPAPATGGISDDTLQRLEQLGKLHEQGVLTDEEFMNQKAALLGDQRS